MTDKWISFYRLNTFIPFSVARNSHIILLWLGRASKSALAITSHRPLGLTRSSRRSSQRRRKANKASTGTTCGDCLERKL